MTQIPGDGRTLRGPWSIGDLAATCLVTEGLALVSGGTPPADPVAGDLIRRWDALGASFHREESTKTAARALWQNNSAALSASLPWTTERLTGLVQYLQEPRSAGAGR